MTPSSSPEQDELDKILLLLHTVHCDKVSAYAPNTPKEFVHSRSCTCGVAKAHAAIRTWALSIATAFIEDNYDLITTARTDRMIKIVEGLHKAFGQEEKQ